MIFQVCQTICLLLLAPLVTAAGIYINITEAKVDQGVFRLSWTSTPSDPTTFTIFFLNSVDPLWAGPIPIAENVPTSLGGLQLDLPRFPAGDGYYVDFVSIDSTLQMWTGYAQSEKFSIDAEDVTKSVNTATFTLTYPAFTPIYERVNTPITVGAPASSTGSTTQSTVASSSASAAATASTSAGMKARASVSLAIFGSLLTVWAMAQ